MPPQVIRQVRLTEPRLTEWITFPGATIVGAVVAMLRMEHLERPLGDVVSGRVRDCAVGSLMGGWAFHAERVENEWRIKWERGG